MITIGIDIGSTTIKSVVMNSSNTVLHTSYERHNLLIRESLLEILLQLNKEFKKDTSLSMTGSVGHGYAMRYTIPYCQEVIACAAAVKKIHPSAKLLLDIGGEDSKMLMRKQDGTLDFRMNGSCAGGTGAFLDQLTALLDVPGESLNDLGKQSTRIYPIASRCGVFAKSDIQNLLSKNISKPDIIASVMDALSIQFCNTLIRGVGTPKKVLFSGGPFYHIPLLREIFMKRLELSHEDIIPSHYGLFFPAMGAALKNNTVKKAHSLQVLIDQLHGEKRTAAIRNGAEKKLFKNREDRDHWEKTRFIKTEKISKKQMNDKKLFLGIDSGSTSTKMVLLDHDGKIADRYYVFNNGNHIQSVEQGLSYFQKELKKHNKSIDIAEASVTGYGEELVKTFFDISHGVVEPLAHYTASKTIVNNPSFILDIGGQDMKAIFIQNGSIKNIEINEACSSGCGSFIQNFAESFGYSLEEFSKKASLAQAPCSLGSRCTIFMNSLVKEQLHQGQSVDNIAAGLAYSISRNSIEKVLKIKDVDDLGDSIIVQGGTFLNPAIHRAFELYIGKKVLCPDISGHMGALGAAIHARNTHLNQIKQHDAQKNILYSNYSAEENTSTGIQCSGCEQNCQILKSVFPNKKIFYTGNRCEKHFSNNSKNNMVHENIVAYKTKQFLTYENKRVNKPKARIGIPRAFLFYENFPFWHTLFHYCGFEVIVSTESTYRQYQKGTGSIMSDSICFPAKLVHGHIYNLIEQKVDRIFFPAIKFEPLEQNEENSYNCPIVTGYSDLINNSIDPYSHFNIPLDKPSFTFKDNKLLKNKCRFYFKSLGISHSAFKKAFQKAVENQTAFKTMMERETASIVKKAKDEKKTLILLAGKPYHIDPLVSVNLPKIINRFGFDFILADYLPPGEDVSSTMPQSSWAFSNRLYKAALFAKVHENIEMVYINSFSCGPDAIAIDAVMKILWEAGKKLTVIKVDEMQSTDSVTLRIRTLVESLGNNAFHETSTALTSRPLSGKKTKTILIPSLSPFHSPMLPSLLKRFGVDAELLPPPDKTSEELGIKYSNNDICYPAILVVGDILKALKSGKYNTNEISVGISQTGGQCRLSSYKELIERALHKSGFENVPIAPLAFSVEQSGHTQYNNPAVKFGKRKIILSMYNTLLFGDALTTMYYAMAVREKNPGQAKELVHRYFTLADNTSLAQGALSLLPRAVEDFNSIEEKKYDTIPKIGIVGEIYVKLCAWPNRNILEWLTSRGVQPIVPSPSYFLPQMLVNKKINQKEQLIHINKLHSLVFPLVYKQLQKNITKADRFLKGFKYYWPVHDLKNNLKELSPVINPIQQAGEGWLIAAEILNFSKANIHNVICLQPFGCIANQVSAKGIENKLKEKDPLLNILYLDLGFDTCNANYFNRINMLVDSIKSG
ncbi:MAG: hypothetical protein GY754_33820 [bacterium]|nr:hypothetical protein [bacterium]